MSDILRPNPARMYDYMLGGSVNFLADRQAVEAIREVMPDLDMAAWANRTFHQRAAAWMARQGIGQFIDIGCGLPTAGNTHQVVQRINRAARVAYADHDPVVIQHAGALLARTSQASVLLADVRDPGSLLAALHIDGLINLARPAGLLCTAVLHFVADTDDPWRCLARLTGALAPGSVLALSHVTADRLPPRVVQAGTGVYQQAAEQVYPRTRAQVERFFTGLDLLPPGPGEPAAVCPVGACGAENPVTADDTVSRAWWAGVARKPAPATRGTGYTSW